MTMLRMRHLLGACALGCAFAVVPSVGLTAQEERSERDILLDSLRTIYDIEEGDVPVVLEEGEVPVDPFAAPAPFGPGEHLEYKVKVGIFNAGDGYMSVLGIDEHEGNPVYRVNLGIVGGIGPARVNDMYHTWFDVTTLQTWRYIRDIDEVGYQSYRHWEFYPDIMRWERIDFDRGGDLGSALPLDEISFIYYIRTLPLEVGKTYTLNRYFKEDGNPVKVTVLRRDQRETEGVLYNTIVVSPEIQSDGLFGQGGKGEIHFTDDERRLPVYVKSDIQNFPGSLTLHLRRATPGHPLNPESRAEAMAGREQRAQVAAADSLRR